MIYTNDRRRLLAHLKRGGTVTRDNYGGGVGVQWSASTRTGKRFDPMAADRLLENGCKIGGVPHIMVPVVGSQRTYGLESCA